MKIGFIVYIWSNILVIPITTKILSESRYRYHVDLDRFGRLHLDWDLDYEKDIIKFRLTANLGSNINFGIGFSDYGELSNADFAVYWRDLQHKNHFQDCWTDNKSQLHVDTSQDCILNEKGVTAEYVDLEFTRKFDTCDGKDYTFDNGTTHIVYFIGEGLVDGVEGLDISIRRSGLQRVQLLKPDIAVSHFPDDTWAFDIKVPHITVPSADTTYWWYRTKLPNLPKEHHIIKYEGVIQPGSEHLVHHMEVFHCDVDPRTSVRSYNGPGLSEGKPPELGACRNVIGAWAMGAGPFVFPNEAGTLVGGPYSSRYILLEVHYNNPELNSGHVDSSGIRFHVTSKLRPYNAGIMELGLEYTNKMAIPPRQSSFSLTGHCISSCTQTGLPKEGIHVFGSQLHTHLTGVKAFTSHSRYGVELPELNRDNHYSPHFQEIRRFAHPVEVLPGDALTMTCIYNTESRSNATIGGFSIQDEMCVNYIHYYPKIDLEVCKSSVDTLALYRFFHFTNNLHQAETSPTKGDRSNYQSITWDGKMANLLDTFYNLSPIDMQCNKSDGSRFPGNWNSVPKTTVTVPLPKAQPKCRRDQRKTIFEDITALKRRMFH